MERILLLCLLVLGGCGSEGTMDGLQYVESGKTIDCRTAISTSTRQLVGTRIIKCAICGKPININKDRVILYFDSFTEAHYDCFVESKK